MAATGRGARNRRATQDLPNKAEDEIINVLDLEKQLDFRLTTDERWALQAMYGPPQTNLSDSDKRKARMVVNKLTRELSQVFFGKRLVYAAMREEVPIEQQAALLPYALPKAPTEIDMTVRKEDLSDEQLDARIKELLGENTRMIDV